MYLASCTNTHCDVTDLVNHGMIKNTKTWISWERNIIFLGNKKILHLCLRWHILRRYGFVAEVTFKSLLIWCFRLCSDSIKFHHEIDKLKIRHKNSYLHNSADKCIKEFLDKIVAPKTVVTTVPEKAILYLGTLSLWIHTIINHIMKNKLMYCNIWFVFWTECKISNFFTSKDKIPMLRFGIVYKLKYAGCNATY